MKKRILPILMLSVLALGCSARASAKSVPLNGKVFPDKVVQQKLKKWDKNRDGRLSGKELKKIRKLDFEAKQTSKRAVKFTYKSLNCKGLDKLTSLKSLSVTRGYRIRNLTSDSLKILNVDQYSLSKLNVSKIPNLEEFYVNTVAEFEDACDTAYRAVKNPLTDLSDLPNLRKLDYWYTEDERDVIVNISQNTKLESVRIEGCVQDFDGTGFTELKSLDLMDAKGTVNLSSQSKLKSLFCSGRDVVLTLPTQSVLEKCSLDNVKGIDVSNQTELTYLGLQGVDLYSELSQNTKLEYFSFDYVKLAKNIDLTNKPWLKTVYITAVVDVNIDLAQNTCLETLYLHGITIGKFVMPENDPGLKHLQIEECNIPEVNLNGCPNIEAIILSCNGNLTSCFLMPKITAGNLLKLKYVSLRGSKMAVCKEYSIADFDISIASNLKNLWVEYLPNYQFDISWFPKIEDWGRRGE